CKLVKWDDFSTGLFFIENSIDIKTLLNNPKLRQLLKEIDSSPNPNALLYSAMVNRPDFQRFANTCLDIVDPIDTEEHTIDVEDPANVDQGSHTILRKLNELLEDELSKYNFFY
uniref:Zinc finger HIT domain-containing protein n=1 Tax=Romanomermis culicivorax TaxID=13658 RepID=A0A915KL74_ROMCU